MSARSATALIAIALASTPASAGRGDDRQCADTPNSEVAIAACTRLYENEGLGARNRAIALGNRGAALKMLGRYDEAIADFALAIELDPKNPQYYCQRGDILVRNKAFADAIADYTAALKRAPSLAWAYHGRGQAYLAEGKAELAADDFTKALRGKPGELNLLVLRGRANTQLGRYEEADADLSKALANPAIKKRLPKERASVLSLRAFTLLKRSRAEEARPDAEEAVKLAPKNAFAQSVMGLVNEQLGRRAEAKDAFTTALAVEPELEVAKNGLARLDQSPSTSALAEPPPPARTSGETQPAQPRVSKATANAKPVEELCARYLPTVGQNVLVACDR